MESGIHETLSLTTNQRRKLGKEIPILLPTVQQDLNAAKCGIPGCEEDHPVFIHSKCHPNNGVDASYNKESGCLVFHCNECKTFIITILVGKATVN